MIILLVNFRVENYKSIHKLSELNLKANNKLNDHNDSLIKITPKFNILPIISIYGANASGKSNLIKAINAMKKIVLTNSLKNVVPFMYDEKNNVTFFEIELLNKKTNEIFRYGFTCDKIKVHEEWLYKKNVDEKDDDGIFIRNNVENIFHINSIYDNDDLTKALNFNQNMISETELLLSTLLKMNNINKYDSTILSTIVRCMKIFFVKSLIYFNTDITEKVEVDLSNDMYNLSEKLVSEVVVFMKEIDPSIEDIKVVKEKDDDLNEVNNIKFVRRNKSRKLIETSISLESSGTKKILLLFPLIWSSLVVGNILIVDELDIKLHPLLFRKIVKLYMSENPKNSQIIFTSHSIVCLDSSDLRRDSIVFTEKNKNKNTDVFPLSSIRYNGEVIRTDLDFGKNYLLGRFGAIPFSEEQNGN